MLVEVDDRIIHYDLLGPEEGFVACLLHSLSSDTGVWAPQVPALLAEGWRVLRLDMRGHGGSQPGEAPYSMEHLADDVAGVLDFLHIDRIHLIGLSIGGMIAQSFAIRHGQRLHSLLLCGTSASRLPGGMEKMWIPRFEAIAAAGSVEPLADASMERWVTDSFRPQHPGSWQQIRETVARTSPEGYRGGGIAIENFDVTAQLPSLNVRTLVVCGDQDPGTPPECNRRIAELIPGARYLEMPNARHFPMVEYPERFNRMMITWLCQGRVDAAD